ncbi:MAG: peptide chain release factor N(5)-glutamine methyltransferase [Chloroflexota bacterium]
MPSTIKESLQTATAHLRMYPTARLDAQVLLCAVLDVDKAYLVAHDTDALSTEDSTAFQELVARRATGEPIAYILGKKEFWDLEFHVSPAVLIPRPETEHLVEKALALLKTKPNAIVADIGTGSGAIAVTIAKHSTATVHATDISPDALAIARQNAEKYDVAITFHEVSLAQPLIDAGTRVDLLLANLPYIREDAMPHLEVAKHEPTLALVAGEDGLDLVRELLRQVPNVCNEHAHILLEIGMEQGQAVKAFAEEILSPESVTVIKDYAGLDRIVYIQL